MKSFRVMGQTNRNGQYAVVISPNLFFLFVILSNLTFLGLSFHLCTVGLTILAYRGVLTVK